MRVATGAAGGECVVARGKGLAGAAGEMHAGIARDGHHLARPKLPSPIVVSTRHGSVAVRFQFRLDLGAEHELPALEQRPESPETLT